MLGNLFPLPDPISERAFQLHYGKAGMTLDLLAACMRLLAFLAMLIKACWKLFTSASWAAAAAVLVRDSSWWMNLTMQTSILLVYVALGQEKYILSRGTFSIVHRVLYALAVASTIRPGDCKNCHLYWHLRSLITNSISVLCRTPAIAYWVGSVGCWTAQLLVFMADPQHICGPDMGCMAQGVLRLLSQPVALLQKLQQPATLANAVFLMMQLVVPGLLLTYLEHRARQRFCFARQHTAAVDGGETGSGLVDRGTATQHQHEKKQQEQQQEQGCHKGTCSSADIDSNNTSQVSNPQKNQFHAEQLSTEPIAQQVDDTSDAAAAAAAAKGQAGGSSCAGSVSTTSAGSPGRNSIEAEAPHTPAIQGTQSVAAIKELAAAVAASMHHQPPSGRAPQGSFSNTAAAPVGYKDLMPARMIIGGEDNLGTVTGPTLGPLGRSMLCGSRRRNGAAASAGVGGVAVGSALQSALYVSPVRHQIMSFKFDAPLNASPQLFEQFKAELTTLVRQYHTASGDPRPLVTQFSAFPGCYQIVLSVAFMASAAAAGPSSQHGLLLADAPAGSLEGPEVRGVSGRQQLQQHLQQQVEQLLQGWPGWSLMTLQLDEATSAAAIAAAAAAAAAANPAAAAAAMVMVYPQIFALPSADAGAEADPFAAAETSSSSSSRRSSSSSSGTSVDSAPDADGPLSATVMINRSMLHQLQCEGYVSVRVVAVLQATAEILLDQSWQLQDMLAQQHGTAQHHEILLPVVIERPDSITGSTDRNQQQRVLNLVVLVEKLVSSNSGSRDKALEQATTTNQQQQQQQHPGSLTLGQLPLLLLPAAATAGLHSLLDEAVQAGLSLSQARLDMLDLVRDLAAVMYAPLPICLSAYLPMYAPLASAVAAQQEQYQAIHAALMQLFSSRAMTACLDLLQACVLQSGLLHTGVEVGVGPAAAAVAAMDLRSDQLMTPDKQAGHQFGLPPNDHVATPSRMSTSSSSSRVDAASSSSSSSTSSSADEIEADSVAGRDPSWVQRAASCVTLTVKQQFTLINREGAAQPAVDAVHLLDCRNMSVDDLRVDIKTSLLGFNHQLPGMEALYLSFKSAALHSLDLLVTSWYLTVLAVLLLHTVTHYMQGASKQQLLIDAFRSESVVVDVLAHGLVLSASYPHLLPSLQQYRSAVLVAALAGHSAVVQGCLRIQSCRDAMVQVLRSKQTSPTAWLTYHHVMKPLTLRISGVATIGYLLVLLVYHWLVDPVVGAAHWPRLWSWVVCLMNVSVAWFLEVLLRRRFLDEVRVQQQQLMMIG